jgi:hypothetical protein
MSIESFAVAVQVWSRVVFAAAVLLLCSTSPADAARPHPHPLSIADARELPLGTRVTLTGTVSTPSGAFASSFFDFGFGLQDHSAGIYISVQTDLALAPQDAVRVTGTLADSYGLLVVLVDDPDDIDACGRAARVEPRRLKTSAVGESSEGLLVSVKGTITEAPSSDLPYGYKFAVDDGSGTLQIFVNLETGIDVTTLSLGQRVSVTGFSSQFDDHYEIDPRSPSDIHVLR